MTHKEIQLLATLEMVMDKDPIAVSNHKLIDVYGLETYRNLLDAADGCECTMAINMMTMYKKLLAKYKTATRNTPKH